LAFLFGHFREYFSANCEMLLGNLLLEIPMTRFCSKFFGEKPHDVGGCPQCSAAQAEVEREEKILNEIVGGLYHRSDLEKAALDCHGQP